jgi:dGTPase
MTSIPRQHEEPALASTLKGFEQDLWRLTHSRAYRALAAKSSFPALVPDKPTPSLLLLATDATRFARILAHRLSLDVPLTECLLLARLLGYPAGGDFSVRLLSGLMQKHGGFSLNEQSLRIIDELEMVFPEFNGLNISWDIRYALGATPSQFLRTSRETASDQPELGVAAFATRLTLIQLHLLYFLPDRREAALQDCPLWQNVQAAISATYPRLEASRRFTFTLHQFLLRLLDEASLVTGRLLVTLSPASDGSLQDLEHHLHVEKIAALAQSSTAQALAQAFSSLFAMLLEHPQRIPEKHALRIKKDGVHRVVCDYLSSLADEQLLALYHQEIVPVSPPVQRTQMNLL